MRSRTGNILAYKINTDATPENPTWSTDGGACGWAVTIATFKAADGTPPSFDLLSGLVSYWKLDEASGTRVDSHSTNDLTDNNTVTSVAGKIGNAAEFEADNSEFLSHATNGDLEAGDIDYTIACWVFLESKTNPYLGFVTKDSLTANGRQYYLFYASSSDRFVFGTANGGGAGLDQINEVSASNFGSPSLGVWYYLVAWHDSSANTTNIQVNNGTVNSLTDIYTPTTAPSLANFLIGGFDNAGSRLPMDGLIDEVGFWKRRLIPAERTALYNGGAGFAYPFGAGPPLDPLLLAVTN